MYFFFYVAVVKYPNPLTNDLKDGSYLAFSIYIAMHLTAIYFFLTSGNNPGWADEHD